MEGIPLAAAWRRLVVRFSLDPAARVAAQYVATALVVDEDCHAERHRRQPPRPPAHHRQVAREF